MSGPMEITASCHCGAVELRATLTHGFDDIGRCTCSFCARRQAAAVTADAASVVVTKGADNLTLYTWGTGTAQHYFCKTCGIKPFYTPRSNPDGIDVNINCLDTEAKSIQVKNFDGRNWEENAHALAHKSRE